MDTSGYRQLKVLRKCCEKDLCIVALVLSFKCEKNLHTQSSLSSCYVNVVKVGSTF